MDFKQSLAVTLKYEGGFANDPDDRGGATMCGVTQATYNAYRIGIGKVTQDVKLITRDEIESVYRRGYWFPSGASSCEGSVMSLVMFDFAVNSGVCQALKSAQKALGLVPDGVLGPKTVGRLAVSTPEDALAVLDEREALLRRIVDRNPTQSKFLKGWLRRVAELKVMVSK